MQFSHVLFWLSRLTIWNWIFFQSHWCYHKTLISLARNWQLGSPHPYYYKNWTNDACFRSEGTKENTLDNLFTSEDTLVEEHIKFIEKQGLFEENLGQQLENIIRFFLFHWCMRVWFPKDFGSFCGFVNAWRNDLLKFLYILWLCWCVGATTHKFHDLCDCVDVCKLPMLVGFLWLCQCLQIFVLCDCVDIKKNQQRCISTSCMNDPKKTSL
jgi:hypothetical protein